jgi:hypothetical protein
MTTQSDAMMKERRTSLRSSLAWKDSADVMEAVFMQAMPGRLQERV